METREEIEEMKVSELRDFLKRHGTVPHQVTRVDGTPGYPRKADLLQIALNIEQSYRSGHLVTTTPNRDSTRDTLQSSQQDIPNPFQSKLPSPSRRASMLSPDPDRPRRSSVTTPRREQPDVPQLPPDQFTPRERTKRRSSTPWIDPTLLKALKTTPRQPELEKASSSNRLSSAQREPEPEVQEVPVQRRDRTSIRETLSVHDDLPSRKSLREAGRDERQSLFGQPLDDDSPPSPPQPILESRTEQVTYLGKGPLLPDDQNDPDYDIKVDIDESGDDSDNDLFNEATLDQDRGDILVQSDHEGTAAGVESDFDSIVGTDDEGHESSFDEWSITKLKGYLSEHSIGFLPGASKSDLVCLVRAHSLQMETEFDQANASGRKFEVIDEDVITPVERYGRESASKQSRRRRRIITAPTPDDEGEGEIRSKRKGRSGKKFNVDDFAAKQRESKRKRDPRAVKQSKRNWAGKFASFFTKSLFPVFAVLLLGLAFWAAAVLLKELRRPYCSAEGLSESDRTGCIACPKNGDCSTGSLLCDPGYTRVGSTCVEDKGNTQYATEIVKDAYLLLAKHAGRAECGDVESRYVSEDLLRDVLESEYSERKERSFLPWMHREHDGVRFSLAFDKAVSILQNEDFEEILYDEMRGYAARDAIRSFWCATKLKLWENWQIVGGLLSLIMVCASVKIEMWRRRRDQLRLADAYQNACDHLSDRKRGFLKGDEEFAFISDVVLRQEVLGLFTSKNIQFWKRVEEVLKNDKRIAYTPNRTIKGAPMNTFEWRGRMSTGDLVTSDGSVRSYEGSVYSEGFATPNRMPVTPSSRLEGVRRWLWNS